MDYSNYKKLQFRRKFFKLFGAEIDITEPESGQLVGFIEMKAWVLREDVRVYSDKQKTTELFRIHARSIIDFGVTYDVFDSRTNEAIFSMRRMGLKSAFIRDQWEIKDAQDSAIGMLKETSNALALVRRYTEFIPFVGIFIDLAMSFWPITYSVFDSKGMTVATLVHQRNPLIVKIDLSRSDNTTDLDPRIPIALTAMLSVMDASKN